MKTPSVFEVFVGFVARIAIVFTVSLTISDALDERGLFWLGAPIILALSIWAAVGDTKP